MCDPKVCVISLIGKSQLMPGQSKAWKLNSILQITAFKTETVKSEQKRNGKKPLREEDQQEDEDYDDEDDDVDIQAYFDISNNVMYLNLESIFDTNNIVDLILNEENKNSSFFKLWEHEQSKYVKAVLLLFLLSHLIIVSNPSIEFDIGYIRFFRIIDTLRNKLLPPIIEILKLLNLPISKEWIYAGRPCSPRVLFTFENCSKDMVGDSDSVLTKLEGLLEDQIYESLRKSYVITNISNNSLFAIPANNTFVYIHRLSRDANQVNSFLLAALHKDCVNGNNTKATVTAATPKRFSYSASRQQQPVDSIDMHGYDSQLFSNFIYQHVTIAFKEGFNDNIGRTNIAPIFELPKLSNWLLIYETLHEAFFNTRSNIAASVPTLLSSSLPPVNDQKLAGLKTKLHQHICQIKPYVDIDVKFSINRCKKSLPNALSVYQEGLPSHYTRQQHKIRLDKALHAYSLSARGPMYKKYREQLEADCLNIWKQGRQLCEHVSLTGNSCTNEMHRVDQHEDKNSGDNNLPVKQHNSNVITIATSNCGYQQKERIDPFNLKDANYTFYQSFNAKPELDENTNSRSSKAINRKVVYFDLPVFKPTDSMAVSSSVAVAKNDDNAKNLTELNTENLSANNLSQDDRNNQGEENQNDSILSDLFSSKLQIGEKQQQQVQQQQQQSSPSGELFQAKVAVTTASSSNNTEVYHLEAQLSSKTVYLAGMTHSDSQPGLLPLFSSWSLCSIGKYSDYSTHSGLTQPGFLPGTNHLLPWDIHMLKSESKAEKNKSKYLSNSLNKKSGKDSASKDSRDSSLIRCYVGMEYECPCGHRFICSAPGRSVKVSSNGTTKDDATKLINGDMPLYTACPCRNSKDLPPFMAQLMRIFIAIPSLSAISQPNDSSSSHVHILLQPKVQPNPPPCPVFRPSFDGPIKLTDNSIWVLRLPYIYMGDEKPYYRPKDFETLNNCRVLQGMFTCVEK